MARNNLFSLIQKLSIAFSIILLFAGCASIGPGPKGGPKDKTPPKVLNITPPDLSRNFKAKKVDITFDEYFKLVDQAKQFSISPDLARMPTLKVKKKILEITIADSLEKNTTYTLNFGKAIVDINEGNILKNFSYVFSTGNDLDSLSLSGTIRDAWTGKPVLDAVAMILPLSRDSLFGKKRASIYAVTDSSGNYKINNLRANTYKVYVLKDGNSDKIYEQSSDEVGFINEPLVLKGNVQHMDMVLFKENATVFKVIDRKLNTDGSISLSLNQKLKKPGITILDPAKLDADKLVKFTKAGDSAKVWLTDFGFDSVKVSVTNDGKLLQTVKLTRGKKDEYKRTVVPTDNIEGNLLNPHKTLQFTFGIPIQAVDPTKIILLEDSVPQTDFVVKRDSIDFLTYNFSYKWKANSAYDITFKPGAFTAIFKTESKEIKKKFEMAKGDDYGTLITKIVVPEPNKQYLLEVFNEAKKVVNNITVSRDTTVTFANYRSGKYFIRIIYDTNKNGQWDTGNVKLGVQPEKVWNEPKELSIRANWDRNETLTLPKEN
ncbi:Ig-like domain-containing protein [Pedobacter sp. L105]|uniref:Ig-like domain-containing protein n=1 Tax=Pedobacter sp. L105 TaxID=1641871 RepID=UPI00131C5581|nr:Ig-like domain-containing protein [Pedobacter sp. L105]